MAGADRELAEQLANLERLLVDLAKIGLPEELVDLERL